VSKTVLAADVSLTHTGIVVMEHEGGGWRVLEDEVIVTVTSPKKRRTFAVDDMTRRATEMCAAIEDLHARFSPAVWVAELPHGSRHAAAARALGIANGVVGATAYLLDLPLVIVTPDQSKEFATGKKNASKAEMMDAAAKLFPDLAAAYPAAKNSSSPYAGNFEHVADAIFALLSATNEPSVKSTMEKRARRRRA
jgi:Holliday junction resolvasome RuvABC endonuclease subunit